MATSLMNKSAMLAGRAIPSVVKQSSVAARRVHGRTAIQAASATGLEAKTAVGEDLTTHNGTSSVSLSDGFKPFEEVKPEFASIERAAISEPGIENSLAREHYTEDTEKAINEQINTHFNLFYAYNAMSSYFSRDNVALLGFGKMFRRFADQNYGHALVFQDFQAKRGGRTTLGPINAPNCDYGHDKGDGLYALELTLGFEKLSFRKLREVHAVTENADDAQAQDFIETRLTDQVQHVKIVADYVAEVRRLGKGHGTWHFDRMLRDGSIDPANAYTTNIAPLSYS